MLLPPLLSTVYTAHTHIQAAPIETLSVAAYHCLAYCIWGHWGQTGEEKNRHKFDVKFTSRIWFHNLDLTQHFQHRDIVTDDSFYGRQTVHCVSQLGENGNVKWNQRIKQKKESGRYVCVCVCPMLTDKAMASPPPPTAVANLFYSNKFTGMRCRRT